MIRQSDSRATKARQIHGQAMIECLAVASVFIIPLSMFMLDVFSLILCNSINDGLAKSAARAAAQQPDSRAASRAALEVINRFRPSSIVTSVQLDNPLAYRTATGAGQTNCVVVNTNMSCRLPVPIPGMPRLQFRARAVEPITALAPAPRGADAATQLAP